MSNERREEMTWRERRVSGEGRSPDTRGHFGSGPRGRLEGRLGAFSVAVPDERWLHVEAAVQAPPPLLPAVLVLELLLGQRGRLAYAMRVAELHRQLRRLRANPVPRRPEGELVGDRADAPRVDVDRE